MRTPSRNHGTLDRRLANQAGFAFPAIDAMLDLKKPLFAIGVDIIGDRRTARGDGLLQYRLHRQKELAQLFLGKRRSLAARPHSCTKQ